MELMRQEEFWINVSRVAGGLEPILRFFLEANGFRNYGSFLNTVFTDEMAERMEKYVRSLRESNKYFQIMSDWYDEPLAEFQLLEGWKSSLRTVFIAMNACDSSKFAPNTERGGSLESLKRHVEPTQINPIILQQTSKRYKHDEYDPNFIRDLIAKFQTKIFTKLKECDANLKIKDKSEINVNYVSEMENGKKFEVKCLYCASTLVIYWRYSLTSANGDTFYPKINECNYFKHVLKHHPESGFKMKPRGSKNDNQEAAQNSNQSLSIPSENECLVSLIKVEDPEW